MARGSQPAGLVAVLLHIAKQAQPVKCLSAGAFSVQMLFAEALRACSQCPALANSATLSQSERVDCATGAAGAATNRRAA